MKSGLDQKTRQGQHRTTSLSTDPLFSLPGGVWPHASMCRSDPRELCDWLPPYPCQDRGFCLMRPQARRPAGRRARGPPAPTASDRAPFLPSAWASPRPGWPAPPRPPLPCAVRPARRDLFVARRCPRHALACMFLIRWRAQIWFLFHIHHVLSVRT
jgi:hypothetical protein